MSAIQFPFLYAADPTKGRPLSSGQIYVGEPDLDPITNPKQLNVIQEDGTVVPVSQPFILSAGGVPVYNGKAVRLDVAGNYSIKILDKNGGQVYYVENAYEGEPLTAETIKTYYKYGQPVLLSEAVADENAQEGDTVIISDRYYSLFEYRAGQTPNSYNVVACTGVPTLSLVLVNNLGNVKAWGAKGDGSTDDLTVCQATADYIGASGGGELFFPAGDYYFQDNFITGVNQLGLLIRYSNMDVRFESKAAKVISNPAAQTRGISVAFDANSNPAQELKNITIHGGSMDGQNGATGAITNEFSHGLNIRRARNVHVHNMHIFGYRGDQIFVGYGAEVVNIHHNTIDGDKDNSISGVRQGVSVLSGRDVQIHNNNIRSVLIPIDIEIDDNQISFGYNYLQRIDVVENIVSNASSEAIDVITPLVSSACVIEDITVSYNTATDIDETIIDVDIDINAGIAKRVSISGNTSDGSKTFKGISISGVDNVDINNNILGACEDNVIQIGERCTDIRLTSNSGISANNDAIRMAEFTAMTRTSIALTSNIVSSQNGAGIFVNGAYELSFEGGNYKGTNAGAQLQGSNVGGANTRLVVAKTGAIFEQTATGGTSTVIIQDNVQEYNSNGSTYKFPTGEQMCTVAALVSGNPRIMQPVTIEGASVKLDSRPYIEDLSPMKLNVKDSIPWFNTSAELNDLSSPANSVGKEFFTFVWNTTINKPVYALVGQSAGVWVDAAGVVVNTPV